jgi:hypothetical protein
MQLTQPRLSEKKKEKDNSPYRVGLRGKDRAKVERSCLEPAAAGGSCLIW